MDARPAPVERRTRRSVLFLPVAIAAGMTAALSFLGGDSLILPATLALAVLAIAPLYLRAQLAGLSVLPPARSTSSAGAWFRMPLRVENGNAFLGARDLLFTVHDGKERAPVWTGYLPTVAAGGTATVVAAPRFVQRGRRQRLRVSVTSSFPFRMFERRITFDLPADALVVPHMGRLRALDERIAAAGGSASETSRSGIGHGEFHSLREWRDGESLRGVHWPLSARRGQLLVRELEREDRPSLHVYLVTDVATPAPRDQRSNPSFERAVSLTATIVERYLRRGHRLGMTVLGPERRAVSALRGRSAIYAMLAELAEVSVSRGDPFAALSRLDEHARSEIPIVVLSGRAASGTTPRGVVVLDVDAPDNDRVFDGSRPRHAAFLSAR